MIGLLGRSVSRSFSKSIHEALGKYEYRLFNVEPQELQAFLRSDTWTGLNVTMPYKQAVIPYCDVLTPLAQRLGAVNTLYRQNGRIVGDNTDYAGFRYMAERAGVDFRQQRVLLLGNGGAAAALRAAALDMGAAAVYTASRSAQDGLPSCGLLSYAAAKAAPSFDILINATPVGMAPDRALQPVDLLDFPSLHSVLDIIYDPLRTGLLQQAAQLGFRCASGLSMLTFQATAAAERFSGEIGLTGLTDRLLRDTQQALTNLVLTGMGGVGKTAAARILSHRLSKPWVDTDQLIEARTGMQIPEIFRKKGEPWFRDMETDVIRELSVKNGLIIATGGGVILREENIRLLRQNGLLIFIDRNPVDASGAYRPLYTSPEAIRRLYEARLPLYRGSADYITAGDRNPQKTAGGIRLLWEGIWN